MKTKTITKNRGKELTMKQLVSEIHKTDKVIEKFLKQSEKVLNHRDFSNSAKLKTIVEKIQEIKQELDIDQEDL